MYKERKRYQLVYPYDGKKVYETSSLNKGAKRCYEELKKTSHYQAADKFTIMDIDNFKKYEFAIKKPVHQMGGNNNQHIGGDTNEVAAPLVPPTLPPPIEENAEAPPADEPTGGDGTNEAQAVVAANDVNNIAIAQSNTEINNRLSVLDMKLEKIISMFEQQEIDRKNRERDILRKKLEAQKCRDNDECIIM